MGEVSEVVKAFLTQDEYLCIPEHVRKKVDTFIQKQVDEVTIFRALAHSQKHDYEQQLSELENNLSSKCEDYFTIKKELSDALANVDDLQKKLQISQTENLDLLKKSETLEKQCREYKLGHDSAVTEKDNARRELEQRLCEIKVCHVEIEALTKKYDGVLAENCRIIREAGDLRTKETDLKVREKELDDERNMFKQQILNLKDELKKSLEKHSHFEREHIVKKSEFEMHLSHKEDELRILRETNEELHSSVNKLKEQLEKSKQFVAQEHENMEQMHENHLKEIEAHLKIINEYKGLHDNAVAKAQYFEERLSAMQNTLEDVMERHEILVNTAQMNNKYFEESKKRSQVEKAKLKQELEAANDLVKIALKESLEREIEDLSPLLATVKRMVKPGARITQIFANHAELLQELELEQNRNSSLQKHMDAIIEELESRTPIMKVQKYEIEEAIMQNAEMELKLKELLMELMMIRKKLSRQKTDGFLDDETMGQLSDNAKDKNEGNVKNYANEENDTIENSELKKDKLGTDILENWNDLAEIVTYLQTRPAFHLSMGNADSNPSNFFGVKSSAENERLYLRQSFGEGSHTLKKISFEELDVSTASQQEQLAVFHQQLNQLAKRLENKSVKVMDTSCQTEPLLPDENLLKLQESVAAKDKIIKHLESRVGQEDHLRRKLEEQVTQGASMSAQLQVAQDGLKVLQANTAGYKTKLVEVEKKGRNYCTTIAKQEGIIQQMKHMLEDMQRRFEHADAQIKGLQRDNELMRNMQIRTTAQQEVLAVGQQRTDLIFSHLEKLQTSVTKSEAEGHLHLKNSLKTYIAECADVKMKLQKSEESFSKEIVKLRKGTECLEKENCSLRKQVETLERHLVERDIQIAEFSSAVVKTFNNTENQQTELKVERTDVLMRKFKEAELELANCKVKLSTTEQLLETSRKHSVIYKDSCLKLEKDHQKIIDDFNLFKENTKKREEAAAKLEADLRQQISRLQSDLDTANSFKTKFQDASKELESYKLKVETLKSELQDQKSQTLAAEVKYSQQLLAHSDDEKIISEQRQTINSMEIELEDVKIAKVKAESLLENKKLTWDKVEDEWKQEHRQLTKFIDNLNSRNSNLYKQLGEVSAKALMCVHSGVANTAKRKRSDTEDTEPVPAKKGDGGQEETKDSNKDDSGSPPPYKKVLLTNETEGASSAKETDSDAVESENQSLDITSITKTYEYFRSVIKRLQDEKNAAVLKSRATEDQASVLSTKKRAAVPENDKVKKLEEDLIFSARQSNILKNESLNSLSETNSRFVKERNDLAKQLKVMRRQCAVLEARVGEKDKTELETEKMKVKVLTKKMSMLKKKQKLINRQLTTERSLLLRENDSLRRSKKFKNLLIADLRKRVKYFLTHSQYKMAISDNEQNASEMSEVEEYNQSNTPAYEYEETQENEQLCEPLEHKTQRREVTVESEYQDPLYSNATDAQDYQEEEHTEYNTHDVEGQYTDATDETHYEEHVDDVNYEHVEDGEFHNRNGDAEYVTENEDQPYVCDVQQEYVEEEHEDTYYDEEYSEAETHEDILHQHRPVENADVITMSRGVRRDEMEQDEDELDDDEEDDDIDNVVTVLDSEDAESEEHSTNENLQRLLRSGNISLVKRKEQPRNPDIPGNGS